MSDTPLGRFCWFELMTTEPDAAPAFYGAIAGWGTAPFEGAAPEPYTMWMNGETPVGGVMRLPQESIDNGAPPHWLAHVSTPDLEQTSALVKELGGAILMQMGVPEVGDFAIVRDPQGAIFSIYQPAGDAPGHDGPAELGEFSWNELATERWEDAWAFYSRLFGWEQEQQMDMGDLGIYQTFSHRGVPIGGMFDKPPEMPMPAWTFYVRVPDADAATEKVKELGGTVLNGPMEVPGGDRVAQCLDPAGAVFAVHSLAARDE